MVHVHDNVIYAVLQHIKNDKVRRKFAFKNSSVKLYGKYDEKYFDNPKYDVNYLKIRSSNRLKKFVDTYDEYTLNRVTKVYYNLKDDISEIIDILKKFKNLKSIKLGNRYEKSVHSLAQLKNIKSIEFCGHTTTDFLDNLYLFKHIEYTDFIFNDTCLHDISGLTKLKYIKIYNRRTRNINLDFLKNLNSLERLCIKFNKIHITESFNCLKNLKNLILISDYSIIIESDIDLQNLRYLNVCGPIELDRFNKCKRLEKIVFRERQTNLSTGFINFRSDSLQSLKIGGCDYYDSVKDTMDITFLKDVPNLRVLTFPNYFNNNIDELKYLTKLRVLKFGKHFNHSIDSIKYLTELKVLKFGEYFNQEITSLQFLDNLTYLRVGKKFNKSLSPIKNKKIKKLICPTDKYVDYSSDIYTILTWMFMNR